MAEQVQTAGERAVRTVDIPYPPSWMDRLIHLIDWIPGPTWLFYLGALILIAFLNNLIFWIDGYLDSGTFDLIRTTDAFYYVFFLALYHYLTRFAPRSLKAFEPLLNMEEGEYRTYEYQLTVLPRYLGWLAIPLGIAMGILTIQVNPADYGLVLATTVTPFAYQYLSAAFGFACFFALLIRTTRQLRMVTYLHEQATNIEMLELDPPHAFSELTARTGLGIFLVLLFNLIQEPSGIGTIDFIFYPIFALLAVVIFLFPLLGMRKRLEQERSLLLSQNSASIRSTRIQLHQGVSADHFDHLGGVNAALDALIKERDLFQKISTWPWDPRTLRGFASTLLLPVFLWLITRLLERLI